MSSRKYGSIELEEGAFLRWLSDENFDIREFDKDEQMLLAKLPCSVAIRKGNVYWMLEKSIRAKYKMANKTLSETKLRQKVLETFNKKPNWYNEKYKKWENSRKEGEDRSRRICYGLYECYLALANEKEYNEIDVADIEIGIEAGDQSDVSNETVVGNSNSEGIGESLGMQYTSLESSESIYKTNQTKKIVKKRRLYTEKLSDSDESFRNELPNTQSSYATFTQNLVNRLTSTEE